MQHVDGNAIAGPLADFFSFDVTTATARCNGCGTVAELARAMVYTSAAGTVVRCGSCDNVLATLVESGDRAWIGFSGISAIEVQRG
jgi:ribosomal protein S27E